MAERSGLEGVLRVSVSGVLAAVVGAVYRPRLRRSTLSAPLSQVRPARCVLPPWRLLAATRNPGSPPIRELSPHPNVVMSAGHS
jgi:hypothetical protein